MFLYAFRHSVLNSSGQPGLKGKMGRRGEEGHSDFCNFCLSREELDKMNKFSNKRTEITNLSSYSNELSDFNTILRTQIIDYFEGRLQTNYEDIFIGIKNISDDGDIRNICSNFVDVPSLDQKVSQISTEIDNLVKNEIAYFIRNGQFLEELEVPPYYKLSWVSLKSSIPQLGIPMKLF